MCLSVVELLLCGTAVALASIHTAAGRTNCALVNRFVTSFRILPHRTGAPFVLLPLSRDGNCVGHHAARPPSAAQRRCAARQAVLASCRCSSPLALGGLCGRSRSSPLALGGLCGRCRSSPHAHSGLCGRYRSANLRILLRAVAARRCLPMFRWGAQDSSFLPAVGVSRICRA